jgi:hypothetical protein
MHHFRHKFSHDVFISYAHVENKIDSWVSEFHRYLNKELVSRSGHEIRMWRDPRMGPGVSWNAEMIEAARDSAVFVPILSEAWLGSDGCQREFQAFQETSRIEVTLGNLSRIVAAEKTPIKELPDTLRDKLRQRFYS